MAKKYRKCPLCHKKGVHHFQTNLYAGDECRYCNYRKATHHWERGEKNENGLYVNAGFVSIGSDKAE